LDNAEDMHNLFFQTVFAATAATIVSGTAFIVLYILKKTIGLRVSKEEEVDGLDIHEHKSNVYN
jgi:Amt family ammonium transporter